MDSEEIISQTILFVGAGVGDLKEMSNVFLAGKQTYRCISVRERHVAKLEKEK